MFFDLNSYFHQIDEEVATIKSDFDLDKEIDSLAVAIKIRTLIVPLGQRCPIVLENFLAKEEKYKQKLKKIFFYRHQKNGFIAASQWLKNFFNYRWQLLQQF